MPVCNPTKIADAKKSLDILFYYLYISLRMPINYIWHLNGRLYSYHSLIYLKISIIFMISNTSPKSQKLLEFRDKLARMNGTSLLANQREKLK